MEQGSLPYNSYRVNFIDVEAWKQKLQDQGFVVIGGVVSQEDCQSILQQLQHCLAILSFKPDLNDHQSWAVNENYPPMGRGGMIDYIGHSKFQWQLREKDAPVFSRIQKNVEDDEGLIFVPGSHKIHYQALNEIGKGDVEGDWYKFTEEDKKENEKLFARHLSVEAGDFIIWDSRLFHYYMTPKPENIRAFIYICEAPKKKVPEKMKEKRAKAWEKKRCSSHAPGEDSSHLEHYQRELMRG